MIKIDRWVKNIFNNRINLIRAELNYTAEFEKLKLISEESFESLFKQSASLICIINKKGKIIDISETFKDLLGFTREEMINKKANRLDLENYEEERQQIDEKAWNGEIMQFEKGIISKKGKVIYIEVILKKGRYFGEDVLISNSRDITKRKELEKEVNKKTKEYENLLENSPISIIINDENGEIKEFNPAFTLFFGLKKERFLTFNLKDSIFEEDYINYQKQLLLLKRGQLFAVEMQIRYHNDSKTARQALLKTIKHSSQDQKDLYLTQIIDISERIEYEKKLEKSRKKYKDLIDSSIVGLAIIKRKKGKSFPSYLSISYLYNTDGAFLGIMGITRDISELKQKEAEIKSQASKLTSIIESSSHYFFTINKKSEITSFNKLFEKDLKENFGIDIAVKDSYKKIFNNEKYAAKKLTKRDLNTFWEEQYCRAFKGESVNFEIERVSFDHKVFYREIFLNPIYSDSGEIYEVSGISHDTTDKRLYEKELKKSLEEKEVLLKEVHHRVKNNMQVISSILNLQSAYVHDEGLLSILKESQNRIRAMASIHERLYRTKNFSDIRFSEYIKDLAENLVHTYELSKTKIKLKCNIEEVFLTLNASIPCGLIINELISNSLKYAFEDRAEGLIELSLSKSGELVHLILQDDGVGIPESLDIEQTDTLGLQLVSTLVEQIGGKMKLDITKGSKFIITFEPKIEEQ